MTTVSLDAVSTAGIARQITGSDCPRLQLLCSISDSVVLSIMSALDAHLMAERQCPVAYPGALANALAAHIYARYAVVHGEIGNPLMRDSRMERSLEFIRANLDRILDLREVAAAANMSRFHFAKTFRKLTGCPPHWYTVALRIEKARELLLRDDGRSVAEVAYQVGYRDPAHFAAQFLRITGMRPGRYCNRAPGSPD